MDKVKRDVI